MLIYSYNYNVYLFTDESNSKTSLIRSVVTCAYKYSSVFFYYIIISLYGVENVDTNALIKLIVYNIVYMGHNMESIPTIRSKRGLI